MKTRYLDLDVNNFLNEAIYIKDTANNFNYLSEWIGVIDITDIESINEARSLDSIEIEKQAENLSGKILKLVQSKKDKNELSKLIQYEALCCCGKWESDDARKINDSSKAAVIKYCRDNDFSKSGGMVRTDWSRLSKNMQDLIYDALNPVIKFYSKSTGILEIDGIGRFKRQSSTYTMTKGAANVAKGAARGLVKGISGTWNKFFGQK